MEEEELYYDLSYRDKVYTNEDFSDMPYDEKENEYIKKYNKNVNLDLLDDLKENRLVYIHEPKFKKVTWKEDDRIYYWGDLKFQLSESNKFTKKLLSNDLIDYLLPIDNTIYFYSYSNNDYYSKNKKYYGDTEALKRNWTFKLNNSNPYNKESVFNFIPEYKPYPDKDILYTFGLEGIFIKASKIQTNFFMYINSMFRYLYGKEVEEIIIKRLPNEIIENNYLMGFIKTNLKTEPFTYLLLLQTYINNNDYTNNPSFKEVIYSTELLNAFVETLLKSEYLTCYNSKVITPKDKLEMFNKDINDSELEYGFKKLKNFDVSYSLKFINGKINVNDLFNNKNGLLNGLGILDEIKVLIHIFNVQNKLINDINDLCLFYINDASNLMDVEDEDGITKKLCYDLNIFTKDSDYSKILDNLKEDKKKITKIFTNALLIKNYNDNKFKPGIYSHNIIYSDFKPKTAYFINYEGDLNEKGLTLNEINDQFKRGPYKFSTSNYIEGKSLIFEYCNIRITLYNLRGLEPTEGPCRVFFDYVMISFNNEGLLLSGIESKDYPYYVCNYIHSNKDFVYKDKLKGYVETTDSSFSAIRLEFRPETNVPEFLLNEENDFNKILNELFSTIFYIKVEYFTKQEINFFKVKNVNNTFKISPFKGIEMTYNVNKGFTSNLIQIEEDNKIIYKNIDGKEEGNLEEDFIPFKLINKDIQVLKDDEFNGIFNGFDNKFEVKKGSKLELNLNRNDSYENDEIEEIEENFHTLSSYKIPKKIIKVKKDMIKENKSKDNSIEDNDNDFENI